MSDTATYEEFRLLQALARHNCADGEFENKVLFGLTADGDVNLYYFDLTALGKAVARKLVQDGKYLMARSSLTRSPFPTRPLRLIVVFTPEGYAVATGEPPARPAPPRLAPLDLTKPEIREILLGLASEWKTPQDLGGGNGSRHSAILTRLVQHGFAERRQRRGTKTESGPLVAAPWIFQRNRGSFVYRLTDKGLSAKPVVYERPCVKRQR